MDILKISSKLFMLNKKNLTTEIIDNLLIVYNREDLEIIFNMNKDEELKLLFNSGIIKRVEIDGFIEYLTIDNKPIFEGV